MRGRIVLVRAGGFSCSDMVCKRASEPADWIVGRCWKKAFLLSSSCAATAPKTPKNYNAAIVGSGPTQKVGVKVGGKVGVRVGK